MTRGSSPPKRPPSPSPSRAQLLLAEAAGFPVVPVLGQEWSQHPAACQGPNRCLAPRGVNAPTVRAASSLAAGSVGASIEPGHEERLSFKILAQSCSPGLRCEDYVSEQALSPAAAVFQLLPNKENFYDYRKRTRLGFSVPAFDLRAAWHRNNPSSAQPGAESCLGCAVTHTLPRTSPWTCQLCINPSPEELVVPTGGDPHA